MGSETIKLSRIAELSRIAGFLTKYACRSPRLSSRMKFSAPYETSVLSRKMTNNLLPSIC